MALFAVRIADLPVHVTVLLGEMVTVGVGLTETLCKAMFVQPFAAVPTTEKLEVDIGLTINVEVEGPPNQAYDAAPLAVKVELKPEQITVPVEEILTVGEVLTDKDCTAVFVQPELVPLTV